jgi:hypothetical protein
VGLQLLDERRGQCQHELRLALACFDAFAAGELPAAARSLWALSGVGPAAWSAGALDHRADMAESRAVRWAVVVMLVSLAARWARDAVAFRSASDRVIAAVPVAGALELPANLDRAGLKVGELPAQADSFGLADADR